MRWTITKEFKFDAAHRLVNGYEGKCAHLHGHEWRVRVTLAAFNLDRYGFVEDFGKLKFLKEWIDLHLDHATIAHAGDSALGDWLVANGQRHFFIPMNPTSENLANILYTVVRDHFAGEPRVKVLHVEVDETCTSSARFEP